jgi:hypothetical protein
MARHHRFPRHLQRQFLGAQQPDTPITTQRESGNETDSGESGHVLGQGHEGGSSLFLIRGIALERIWCVTPNNFRPYPSLSAPLLSDYAQGTACCLDLDRGSGTEAGDGGAMGRGPRLVACQIPRCSV